eukprot:15476200-Alexandrium_andersonii.AAC.1
MGGGVHGRYAWHGICSKLTTWPCVAGWGSEAVRRWLSRQVFRRDRAGRGCVIGWGGGASPSGDVCKRPTGVFSFCFPQHRFRSHPAHPGTISLLAHELAFGGRHLDV